MKLHHLLLTTLAVFLGGSYYLGYTPIVLSALFFLASLIAYYLYAKDKAAAIAGTWRVPENTLHTAALIFGWPGALIAQERLRHKTKKQSFRIFFWLTVIINLGVIAWLHSPQGNTQLREAAHKIENLVVANVPYPAVASTLLLLTKIRNKPEAWRSLPS